MASPVQSIPYRGAGDRLSQTNYSCCLLAAIVDSCQGAIITKDLNRTATSWNKAAELLLGYTAAAVIGRSIFTIIPPELQGEEREILRKLGSGQSIEHYETWRRRKDGTIVDVSLTISPARDDAGRVIGLSKIARDITGRKEVERLLIQQAGRDRPDGGDDRP